MMACSPQVILKESASILGGYCGWLGTIANSSHWDKREKMSEVQNLIDDITRFNEVSTLPKLAERLNFLQQGTSVYDALHGYIDAVRQFIETRLYNLKKQDFVLEATPDRNGQIIEPTLRLTRQFWEMMSLTREDARTRIVENLHREGCLQSALLTDFPEETLTMVFQYVNYPHATIFDVVSSQEQLTSVLKRWSSLPSDEAKSRWLTVFSYRSNENLLSLTLKFLPERFDEVFGYLRNLPLDEQSATLLYRYINLAERAINTDNFNILCTVLAKIQSLPDILGVNDFLKRLAVLIFARQPDSLLPLNQIILQRAGFLLNAIIKVSDPQSVCQFLEIKTGDDYERTIFSYLARYSPPMYRKLVVFAASLEDGDMKTDLMQKLFWKAETYPYQAKVLIAYVLANPAIQDKWLSFTTKDGCNLLHIASAHKKETSGLVAPLLECMKIHLSPSRVEQILAQKNSVGNTPLIQAAIRSSGAVSFFMGPIMQCKDPAAILGELNLDGESALTLADQNNARLIGKFFKEATLSISHEASSSLCDEEPVEQVVDAKCFDKAF